MDSHAIHTIIDELARGLETMVYIGPSCADYRSCRICIHTMSLHVQLYHL